MLRHAHRKPEELGLPPELDGLCEELERIRHTIALLILDQVQRSGHPGSALGLSHTLLAMWLFYRDFDPQDPEWVRKDSLIFSAGHNCPLLYALWHLSDMLELDKLRGFRRRDGVPGHPEEGVGIDHETSTGWLGHGIASAAGLAVGKRMMQSRFHGEHTTPFGGNVIIIASDGDRHEGHGKEAFEYIGSQRLSNVIYLFDANGTTMAGGREYEVETDYAAEAEANGWRVVEIKNANDWEQVLFGLDQAFKPSDRPTFVINRSTIGYGVPGWEGRPKIHGTYPGDNTVDQMRRNYSRQEGQRFHIRAADYDVFRRLQDCLAEARKRWDEAFGNWQSQEPIKAASYSTFTSGKPDGFDGTRLQAAIAEVGQDRATRHYFAAALKSAGGAFGDRATVVTADTRLSTKAMVSGGDAKAGDWSGRNITVGVRENLSVGIADMLQRMGFVTFVCTFGKFLIGAAMAAILHVEYARRNVIFGASHSDVWLGEDGWSHAMINEIWWMRSLPSMWVIRPATPKEMEVWFEKAIRREDGPSFFCTTRHDFETPEVHDDVTTDEIARGGYVVYGPRVGAADKPDLVIAATGCEVSLMINTAKRLETAKPGLVVRVVSVPCMEVLMEDVEHRKELFPLDTRKVWCEASSPDAAALELMFGTVLDTVRIGISDTRTVSAPVDEIAEVLGFTPELAVGTLHADPILSELLAT